MNRSGHCPRCGTLIQSHRVMNGTIVCTCGWSQSLRSESAEQRSLARTTTTIFLIASLLVGSFIHAVNWDHHFFPIIALKLKQITGFAHVLDLEEIAKICLERKKMDCTEEAYSSLTLMEPQNTNHLNRLGHLLAQREKWKDTAHAFKLYFEKKGTDPDAAYTYALSLGRLKQYDLSDAYYRYALEKKKTVVPVTMVRSYVQMLMEARRFQQAKNVILTYRQLITNASLFMNKELDEIRLRLGELKTAAAREN